MWKYHTSPNGKIITVLFVKLYGSRNIQTQWADDGLSRYKYMYIVGGLTAQNRSFTSDHDANVSFGRNVL